jgi:hypothetical protein
MSESGRDLTGMNEVITRAEAMSRGLDRYFTGKPCTYGHIAPRRIENWSCCACYDAKITGRGKLKRDVSAARAAERQLIKQERDQKRSADRSAREEAKANRAVSYQGLPCTVCGSDIRYTNSGACKRCSAERGCEHYAANKEHQREYNRKYRQSMRPARKVPRQVLKRAYEAIIEQLRRETLGGSYAVFERHIESKWQRGMTWENYGEWVIDHILPLASFDLLDKEQRGQAFHFTNLAPRWARENLVKKDSLPAVHSPELPMAYDDGQGILYFQGKVSQN